MGAIAMVRSVPIALCCVWLLASGANTGCGYTAREMVRDGIDEANKPDNLKKLTSAAHDLASALSSGLSDGVPTSKLPNRFAPLIDNLVRTTLHAAAEQLDTDLSPALARAVRASVDAALATLLADRTLRGVEDMENALISAAMGGLSRGLRDQLGPAIVDTLDKSLGPALRRAIQNELGPALAETITHDLKPTLVDTARQTAKAAGEGFVDGVRGRAEPVMDQLLAKLRVEFDAAKQDAYSAFEIVLFLGLAFAAAVLLMIALLRHRAAVDAADALQLVTSQIGQMRSDPVVRDLAGKIKYAGDGTRAGNYLTVHLRAHPSSKIPVPDMSEATRADRTG